jgi:hypothetical protein
LIYLHQAVINPKNYKRPAKASAGGGDLEGRAEIVNAVFSWAVSATPQSPTTAPLH